MIEKFNIKYFFLIGIFAFSFVVVSNIHGLIIYWDKILISKKVADVLMTLFYFALTIVFYNQYKATKLAPKPLEEKELDKIVGEGFSDDP